MRLAFGTYLKAPNPVEVFGDADWVRTRFKADPTAAFCAELDGQVVGSNFATRWGSYGFFGPITVRPDLWDGGIASGLMAPVMQLFDSWGVRQAALFTFPESVKHIGLYQKFGFWPQTLNPVLVKEIGGQPAQTAFQTFSRAACPEQVLRHCRELTDTIYQGLDVEREIVATSSQQLGETLLLTQGDDLLGFAVCHCGAGSEAGTGTCYVKFGAVRPGHAAPRTFERLLDACEHFTAGQRASQLVTGANTARAGAYEALLRRGYRAILNGVTMARPNEPAFNRPDIYVMCDLR
jgi:GNAT superfamily N-acetyltransferase